MSWLAWLEGKLVEMPFDFAAQRTRATCRNTQQAATARSMHQDAHGGSRPFSFSTAS